MKFGSKISIHFLPLAKIFIIKDNTRLIITD
jgi:hypothetical protein